jgi:hypothetical protein
LIGIGEFWLELKTFGIENFKSKTSEIPNFRELKILDQKFPEFHIL